MGAYLENMFRLKGMMLFKEFIVGLAIVFVGVVLIVQFFKLICKLDKWFDKKTGMGLTELLSIFILTLIILSVIFSLCLYIGDTFLGWVMK